MSFLFLFGKFVRRDAQPNRLLFITGAIMVTLNPLIFLYDTSFHLSFLATFGLINVSPVIYKKLTFLSEDSVLREIIASSIGVELFLIPYLLYSIGAISSVGLFANILLLAYIPATMLFGFVSSALSYLVISFSKIPGFISFILLRYELGIVHLLSSIPHALIKIAVPFWVSAIFYVLAFILFFIRQIVLRRQANLDSQRMLQYISLSPLEDNPAYMNAPTYLDRG
jgi:competence protein ComEC